MKIVISTNAPPKTTELLDLFRQVTWANKRDITQVEALIGSLDVFVTARINSKIVGFGRAVSDGVFRALIDDLIVDEAHQGQGIGRLLMETLNQELESIEEVFLNTGEHLDKFYGSFGFEKFVGYTMKSNQALQRTSTSARCLN